MNVKPGLTEFVLRAQAALEEYQRLRFLGVAHEQANHQSGLYDAIVRPQPRPDARAAAARNDV